MADSIEENNATVPMEEEDEVQRAVVIKRRERPPVDQEFEVGDIVKLSLLENGIRTSKKMEVIEVSPKAGKWWYRVKRPGESAIYRDKLGQELFQEANLSFW